MSPTEFRYNSTRDHVKHEDDLINHRMTWLITLQAFLFGAYGFSLSAEASLTTISNAQLFGKRDLVLLDIYSARAGLAYIGVASSAIMLFPLISAGRAILRVARDWNEYVSNLTPPIQVPNIIGNADRPLMYYLGLVPILGLPIASIGVWLLLIGWGPGLLVAVAIVLFCLGGAVGFDRGVAVGRAERRKD